VTAAVRTRWLTFALPASFLLFGKLSPRLRAAVECTGVLPVLADQSGRDTVGVGRFHPREMEGLDLLQAAPVTWNPGAFLAVGVCLASITRAGRKLGVLIFNQGPLLCVLFATAALVYQSRDAR